jgi:23S rRNA (cytidine1920-2'-O)/16S rRNA (cytidine1409-2'-O)-methyltransferase
MRRLDQELVSRGLVPSREQAKRCILAGQVLINKQRANKPSDPVQTDDVLQVLEPPKYVSRGGLKLEHALDSFAISTTGITVIDLGASTGGFTDCLIQRGAARVFAVDVGQGQLAWKLRQDPRVVVMERTNARELQPANFPQGALPVDLVTVDCSFISLRKILPPAIALLRKGGKIVALIKPQFEAGKREVDKGAGVIRDPAVHDRVVGELQTFVKELGLRWVSLVQSPILGPAGNKEFLALLENAD